MFYGHLIITAATLFCPRETPMHFLRNFNPNAVLDTDTAHQPRTSKTLCWASQFCGKNKFTNNSRTWKVFLQNALSVASLVIETRGPIGTIHDPYCKGTIDFKKQKCLQSSLPCYLRRNWVTVTIGPTILECFCVISHKKISSFFNTLPLRECSSLADDPTEDLLCVLEDQCIPKKGALSGQDIFNQ